MYLCFFTLNLGSRTFTYRNKYRICYFLNYQTCSPTAGFHLHTTSGTFNCYRNLFGLHRHTNFSGNFQALKKSSPPSELRQKTKK